MAKQPLHPPTTPCVTPVRNLGPRERQFASIVWRSNQLGRSVGRSDLHKLTGTAPTPSGALVSRLVEACVLKESRPVVLPSRGRPRIGLEVRSDALSFVGLSISPAPGTQGLAEVRLVTLDPLGRPRALEVHERGLKHDRLIPAAAKLLKHAVTPRTAAVGITVTGMVDLQGHAMLFSSALPSPEPVSLEPLYQAVGQTPLLLDNDLHALATRWRLAADIDAPLQAEPQVVLLVGLDDGRLGASLLIDGRSLPGSVTSANELGHMRLPVYTHPCYCGQTGCLERIFSTQQLNIHAPGNRRALDHVLKDPRLQQQPLLTILDHLATGLANAVNFTRPTRLVIASPLAKHPLLRHTLEHELPPRILPGLRSKVRISFWEQPSVQSAENAAWLAIADLFGHSLLTTQQPLSHDPNTPHTDTP